MEGLRAEGERGERQGCPASLKEPLRCVDPINFSQAEGTPRYSWEPHPPSALPGSRSRLPRPASLSQWWWLAAESRAEAAQTLVSVLTLGGSSQALPVSLKAQRRRGQSCTLTV